MFVSVHIHQGSFFDDDEDDDDDEKAWLRVTLVVVGIESAKPRTRAMKLLEDAGIYIITVCTHASARAQQPPLSLTWT
jgi:hypothetical protein